MLSTCALISDFFRLEITFLFRLAYNSEFLYKFATKFLKCKTINLMKKLILMTVMILMAVRPATSLGYENNGDTDRLFHQWIAGTVVDESEVNRIGLDAWFQTEKIGDDIFARMWKKSWKQNCPLKRSDLRYLRMLHRNAEGKPQRGEMVVNAAIADKVLTIFCQLYQAGYRIERMVLIDNYDANDKTAMQANNSSSFNFRYITGSTTKISKHGMGLAIDINPLYNPYVRRKADGTWKIEPAISRKYAFNRNTRTDIPYKITHNDLAYKLFIKAGFKWGGNWKSLKDYQHFEIDL